MSRKQIIARVTRSAANLAKNAKQGVALRWVLAEDLLALRGTFAQGKSEGAAFLATAATAANIDESVVTNLVAAAEVRAGLTAKNRGRVESDSVLWPTDSVLCLKGVDSAQAGRIIARAEKAGTTNTKSVRGYRREVLGTVKRQRQTGAEATTKLAAAISEQVQKLLKNGHDPMTLAAGANLAREHSGDVAAAILFVAAQVKAAEKVVK
jgi:hypothetical protein